MIDSNRFYVYMHRFANGTLYVGKGTSSRAWQFSPNRHNNYWDRLRAKYGAPRVKILISGLDEKTSLAAEVAVIARFKVKGRSMCNRTAGGDGCVGLLIADETREKLRKANNGKNNGMYGKAHTQKAKDAISAANRGKLKGKLSPRYKQEIFNFVNDLSGDTFSGTQNESSIALGIGAGWVSRVCAGKCASAKGWRLSSTMPEDTGRKGKRHGRYDHTTFDFVHDSGMKESCTKNELGKKYSLPSPSNLTTLCAGRIKSYKGWRLLS